jgi:hypothetical protein
MHPALQGCPTLLGSLCAGSKVAAAAVARDSAFDVIVLGAELPDVLAPEVV